MNNLIFGKYTNLNTIIHRLDSRFKIGSMILLMVLVFLNYGNYMNNIFVLLVFSILILILMLISKISLLSLFKSLKFLWFMIIILLLINCFIPYNNPTHELFKIGSLVIYTESILNSLLVTIRIILMVELTLILTSTTQILDITYAFEWYLTPLKIFKFPIGVISMTITLAIRFIPTLLEEAYKIMKAQKARGVNYNKGAIISKVKSVTTLIIPLLVDSMSRSEELAIAMEARGYDPYKTRSKYRILKFSFLDLSFLIILFLIFSLFIFVCVISSNGFNLLEFIFNIEGTF